MRSNFDKTRGAEGTAERVYFPCHLYLADCATHRRTGTEIRFTSPWNSKSDGNSSPTEIESIRGP